MSDIWPASTHCSAAPILCAHWLGTAILPKLSQTDTALRDALREITCRPSTEPYDT
ncbi:hypothetical protein JQX03_08375 [Sulfitobacter pseudonitzschiae]|nr:hypothetical protein [Pseudosulfitobacter pseudonitzschiae]